MSNPFRYFNSSPEVIRLVVMMYVRYPLSLRNVEDLLAERGIDISHETIRFWWNRFGPVFAAEIRKKRVAHLRRFPQWRWHLDEVFVKINGKLRYLWRAVDHEGEVLEAVVTVRSGQGRSAQVSEARHEEIWPTAERRHRRALLVSRGDERDRQCRPSRSWPSPQQSRGEFAPAISTTRTSHAALSECEDTTKVQFNSRAGPQSFQPGASSRDPPGLQTEALGRAGRVARPRGLATDWLSACHAIRRPRVVTMTKPLGSARMRSIRFVKHACSRCCFSRARFIGGVSAAG